MDPQQELFTEIRKRLVALFGEGSVYDGYLPPAGTPYPFVYLAGNELTDEPNKGAIFGRVNQTINFWHNNPEQRGVMSEMMVKTKQAIHMIEATSNFSWLYQSCSQRILTDDTTKTPLLHGVLQVYFKFS